MTVGECGRARVSEGEGGEGLYMAQSAADLLVIPGGREGFILTSCGIRPADGCLTHLPRQPRCRVRRPASRIDEIDDESAAVENPLTDRLKGGFRRAEETRGKKEL